MSSLLLLTVLHHEIRNTLAAADNSTPLVLLKQRLLLGPETGSFLLVLTRVDRLLITLGLMFLLLDVLRLDWVVERFGRRMNNGMIVLMLADAHPGGG